MHTIGAGGGSIASVDAGGLLHVGPDSAGAHPGPACYGRGGECATVTDANLVLGRLRSGAFLGGAMRLDTSAARRAVAHVAQALGLGVEEAAAGIIRVANQHMVRALRVISVQRGLDPREFTLVSFGGAGGLHVCALAEALGMRRALVPVHAGVLSALGMLAAPRSRQLSRTVNGLLADSDPQVIEAAFDALIARGRDELGEEGVPVRAMHIERSADVRYQGQSYTLNIPWKGTAACETDFHSAHEARYGHRLDFAVELVNVRVGLHDETPQVELQAGGAGSPAPAESVETYGVSQRVAVYDRDSLSAEHCIDGPVLITETVSTTWVAPGWQVRRQDNGNLLLERTMDHHESTR
jgi:N-methylhydantoinase A